MTANMKRNFLSRLTAVVMAAVMALYSIPASAQRGGVAEYQMYLQGQGRVSPSFRQDRNQKDALSAPGMESEMMTRGVFGDTTTSANLSYQVHVLGEVEGPGTYRVMASERLAEVLKRAGGVRDNGSERWIELKRDGNVIKRVDLLKFERFGQLDHNPYLLDNDVIFVPLKANTIRIAGAVKRPDAYELRGEKSLKDVVTLAGGYSTGAVPDAAIRVVRFVDGKKDVMEVSDGFSGFKIQNGDVIYVPSVITKDHKFDYNVAELPGGNVFYPSYEDRVFVLGGVSSPGAYPFSPYHNLSQYLSLAGGTTKMATSRIHLISAGGEKKRVRQGSKKKIVINPGDTILVGERRIPPEGWVSLGMSIAGFGLSTTATVLTLTK